jgi:hypothetical protein
MFMLKHSIEFKNLSVGSGILVNLMYNMIEFDTIPENETSAEAIITISHSSAIKLVPNEEYFGQLNEGKAVFNVFKLNPPYGKSV